MERKYKRLDKGHTFVDMICGGRKKKDELNDLELSRKKNTFKYSYRFDGYLFFFLFFFQLSNVKFFASRKC